jgi:hypothetical protein
VSPRAINYHLIAQAQAAATGQMVHTLASLISSYIGYVGLLDEYPELQGRVVEIENTLRVFCRTGRLPVVQPLPLDRRGLGRN